MKCEWKDCELEAEGYVEGQWSIADFMRFEACFDHLYAIRDDFWHTTIEGNECEVTIEHYWID